MRVLDLFAGIGGFSLAAHWMGWETVAFCEKEPFCQKVLAKNFPGVEIFDDVRTFPSKSFRGRIDLITGGFPCQPFSIAGQREGREDERHLFPAMLDIIRDVRPLWVVAENVRGILSIESGSVFAEVISQLESEGYEVITFCIPASSVNASHRRDRIWFIAHANGGGLPGGRRERSGGLGTSRHEGEAAKDNRAAIASSDTFSPANALCPGSSPVWHQEPHKERAANTTGSPNRNAPDADDQRRVGRSEQGEDRERQICEGRRDDRAFSEPAIRESRIAGVVANSCNSGLQGGELGRALSERAGTSRSIAERFENEHWYEAATRLCRVDDVVPNRVDRLKSLGNAIVPQVAYEIFKAIEEANR